MVRSLNSAKISMVHQITISFLVHYKIVNFFKAIAKKTNLLLSPLQVTKRVVRAITREKAKKTNTKKLRKED